MGPLTAASHRVAHLTPRQVAAVLLTWEGLSDREIALRLGIGRLRATHYLEDAYAILGLTGQGCPRAMAAVALYLAARRLAWTPEGRAYLREPGESAA